MEGLSKYNNNARMYFYKKYESFSSSIIERQTDLSRTSALQPASTFPFCIYSHDIPRLPFTITATQDNTQVRHEDHLAIDRPTNEATNAISPTDATMKPISISSTSVHANVPYLARDGNLKTKKKYKPVARRLELCLEKYRRSLESCRRVLAIR